MIYDVYSKENKEVPYKKWISGLRDGRTERKHDQSLKKVTLGNTSHCKPIRTNPELFEIVIAWGPGFRIYCSKLSNDRFVVLNAGIKDTQQKDIEKAVEYLEDYKKRHPKERSTP
jgi:putative addiction module killer protein